MRRIAFFALVLAVGFGGLAWVSHAKPARFEQFALEYSSSNFGSVAVGTSRVVEVRVRNLTADPVELRHLLTGDLDFFITTSANQCANPQTLAGNGECVIPVLFGPTSMGRKAAQLEVTNPLTRVSKKVRFSGRGV